ncbi:hypothetical protein ACG7TL_000429 [Trametes sanguinea]
MYDTGHVGKTLAAIHGPLPLALPPLILHQVPLRYVHTATYVGMSLTSVHADIFLPHYTAKADAARRAANATLSLSSYTGLLPPSLALQLYRSHVDPHITAGCEVALDIRPTAAHDLHDVQTAYLRRALNISRRSQLPPLYTETGIWPIRYRRYQLALRFLAYLLTDCPPLPYAALRELHNLSSTRAVPTWWTDLHLVGMALPVPVLLDVSAFPTQESVQQALSELSTSLAAHLWDAVTRSNRLPVLQYRTLRAVPQTPTVSDLKAVCRPRAYLYLPHRRQREALALLLFSEHPLAVEQLRRTPPIPREWRVCRFCRIRSAVEDEIHALLSCRSPLLSARRARFVAELSDAHPPLRRLLAILPIQAVLDVLLASELSGPLPMVADYVADIFEIYMNTPPLVITTQAGYDMLPLTTAS